MTKLSVLCECGGGELLCMKQSKKRGLPVRRTRKCLKCKSEFDTLEIKVSDWEMAQTLREILGLIRTIKEYLKVKTIKTERVETETGNLNVGYWDMENEQLVSLHNMSDDELNTAAELIGVSPLGATMMVMFADEIREKVGADLTSIWDRLDQAGIE